MCVGEKPAINSCLKRCQDIADKVSNERLSLADFKQNLEILADLQRKAARNSMRNCPALKQKQNEVDRLIHVAPLVLQHRGLQNQLQPIQRAARLREDFRSDFDKIDRSVLQDRQRLETLGVQLEEVEAELGRIPLDGEVLSEKVRLKHLSDSAGQYQTDFADLPELQTQWNLKQGEAKQAKLRPKWGISRAWSPKTSSPCG